MDPAHSTANMDVEMGDVAYDIDIDVGAGVATSAQPQQQVSAAGASTWVGTDMRAADGSAHTRRLGPGGIL